MFFPLGTQLVEDFAMYVFRSLMSFAFFVFLEGPCHMACGVSAPPSRPGWNSCPLQEM